MVAAEMTPIVKVGGLADVVGALPKSLINLGCEVKIVIPFYGAIDKKKYKINKLCNAQVEINNKKEKISIWSMPLGHGSTEILFIKHDFFASKDVYLGSKVKTGPNDLERFAFFSKAALEAVKIINWQPDVVHCHDWHTALIPVYLKTVYKEDLFFNNTRTLYTIHNLAMQGKANSLIIKYCQLPSVFPTIKDDLLDNEINFMYQGIMNAGLINTVSPTYAKEILTAKQGQYLEKFLKQRKSDLSGILNGIDTDFFNPKTDKFLKNNYNQGSLAGKKNNKKLLQLEVGLPEASNVPVIGIISRFFPQKGIELINDKFAKLDCQFIFLGTGDKSLEKGLKSLAKNYPQKFSVQIKFDAGLAQRIYAGADIFLMPSLFEPCGLGQLIAMRYGTVPVVRTTGGLADTVNQRVGFTFLQFDSNVLYKTLAEALKVYYFKPSTWKRLIQNGMKKDFSWHKSAKEYVKLYTKLTNIK